MVLFTPTIKLDSPKERWFSGRITELMDKIDGCTDCGQCEEKCPYHLPIREMMREYQTSYRAEKAAYEKR
jgi:predicted aldo/keto reductase-like oxidoreductase